MCEIDAIRTLLTTTCDCVVRRAGYLSIVIRFCDSAYPLMYMVTFTSSGTDQSTQQGAHGIFVRAYTLKQFRENERRDWPDADSGCVYMY